MKTIRLSDKEIDFLSALYEDEIQQTENYVDQLKQILAKLGKKVESGITGIKVEPKKRGRKPGTKKAAEKPVKVPKKRGRKPGKKVVKPEPEKKETPKIVKKYPFKKKKARKVLNYRIKPKPLPKPAAPATPAVEEKKE